MGDLGPMGAEGLRVSEFNAQVRELIHTCFEQEFWVVGELQGFDRNTKEHYYFELTERDGDRIKARVSAVLFQKDHRQIRTAFARQRADIQLRDGLTVRVRVKVDYYAASGSLQLVVRDVDPNYTAGALNLQRLRVLQELEKEGIAERNLALSFPTCPLRVGMVTSIGSDAYNDVVEELRKSGYAFEVTVRHAVMQGPQMEASVLAAMRSFFREAHRFDVLLLVRGGGSRSDLAWFDSHQVGRAVCWMPIKVISGVGHHRDQCVLDSVALSVKTPTAAAQAVVQRVAEFEARVDRLARDTALSAELRLNRSLQRLDVGAQRIQGAMDRRVWRARAALDQAGQHAEFHARRRILRESERLDAMAATLERGCQLALQNAERELGHAARRLSLGDPRNILRRGYAVVQVGGKIVSEVSALQPGVLARVTLADGEVDVVVKGRPE